jgi:hypothetical protein
MDEHWIWRTLLIYSFGQNRRRALESKGIPDVDTGSDWGGVVDTKRNRFLAKRDSVDRRPTQEFPRSKSHGPRGDDTDFTDFTAYFTELQIQVKVVQILSSLELERKRQWGRVGMIRDGTDHNRSFSVGLVVGLLGLSEDERLRSRKQDQRTCSRRSIS